MSGNFLMDPTIKAIIEKTQQVSNDIEKERTLVKKLSGTKRRFVLIERS